MKKVLLLTLMVLLVGVVGLADIQQHYDPDLGGDQMLFGDDNLAVFGTVASLGWETSDANANYLMLELPSGGAIDIPVFGIGQGLYDTDLADFDGFTETAFFVGDADADSEIYLSYSADDVGLLAGKGTIASFGVTFATLTNTCSTTLINYTPAYIVGYDVDSYLSVAVADTTGDVTITQTGSNKAVSWTAAGGFSFTGAISVGTVTTATWDPASLIDGAQESKDVTVTGVALGDFVLVSAPVDVVDFIISAQVTATDTVTITVANETGGTIDLATGSWSVLWIDNGS